MIYAGFWKSGSKENKKFPNPKARKKPWMRQKEFLQNLQLIESKIQNHNLGKVLHYKGYSCCRICEENGQDMGSVTFELGGWRWPSGFTHYISKHNVKPSYSFIEFINLVKKLVK
jgi:hypothetical protein